MPKIPEVVITSVFYLYKSQEDAEAGKPFGGTGFLIAVPCPELPGLVFPYAVTNWHVAIQGGASVIRVNKKGGGVDIFDYDPSDWTFVPGGYDLAIVPIPVKFTDHDVTVLTRDIILSKDDLQRLRIGPGDDVFMIGRFVDHDGAGTNVPAARFGHISVMPQPIKQPTGSEEPSFILDIHSRTGYSGAPVFVYRTLASDLTRNGDIYGGSSFLKLLAIHWDQFPERWEIGYGQPTTAEGVVLSDDAQYIKGLSGMTLAVPAWALNELLDMPQHKAQRAQETKNELEKQAKSGEFPLTGEMATQVGQETDNPSHKEDFMSLLTEAAKTPPQGG